MRSCYSAINHGELGKLFFVIASEDLSITFLTRKRVKNSKNLLILKSIFDHILLKGHDACLEDLS